MEELTPEFAARLRAAGIDRLLPHQVLSVQEGVSGSGIYSRDPLRRLPFPAISSTRASADVAPGVEIGLMAVHNLPTPTSPSGVDGWGTGLSQLPGASADGPVEVLAGDFNATIDQSAFRDLLDRGYHDAAERSSGGARLRRARPEPQRPPHRLRRACDPALTA